MILLLAALALSLTDSTVCDLLSFDPETCLSVFGCAYCVDSAKCYSRLLLDGTVSSECPLSNSIKTNSKSLGKCFSLYSDDGCQKCVSRDKGTSCGWCQSLGVCAEGTAAGPAAFECGGEDWLLNKTTCDRSTCASAKSKENCRMPCVWSKRGLCLMPRSVKNAHESPRQVALGRRVFLGAGIAFVSVAIAAVVIIVWRATRPLYKQLPMMNTDFRLDALPSPMSS